MSDRDRTERTTEDDASPDTVRGAPEPLAARLDRMLAGLSLPPLAFDAVKLAMTTDEPDDDVLAALHAVECAADGERRDALARALRERAETAGGETRFVMNACALAVGVLAVAHELRPAPGAVAAAPCLTAIEHVAWFLGEPAATSLSGKVKQLLADVRDGIGPLEIGRAAFVRAVRKQLARIASLRRNVLDVVRGRLVLGGRVVRYRRKRRRGDAAEDSFRVLSTRNLEGRLVLLVADRRPPRLVGDGHVVSRARAALRHAAGGAVLLEGEPLRLVPVVELSERARAVAAKIRFLDRE